ncbi:hypothetical protein K504DRAFT_462576 [Pleomassaria siparia CBS 279.74]|uniref:Uncharacterized protein n=1 Tax=Pleomassaria siparia CBS 279.74 TaxID=1314801 RepID=A0A6G1KND0_9PLEO|nr:hypothetical protein K504DRAFT_462576 [Pleomassaria siparia CBS 279.74]
MPLISFLAVPGSPGCSFAHTSRASRLIKSIIEPRISQSNCVYHFPTPIAVSSISSRRSTWSVRVHAYSSAVLASFQHLKGPASGCILYRSLEPHVPSARFTRYYSNEDELPERASVSSASVLDIREEGNTRINVDEVDADGRPTATPPGRRIQPSRNKTKARRQSQPAHILDMMQSSARNIYTQTPIGKIDLSYTSPRRRGLGGIPRQRHRNTSPNVISAYRSPPPSMYTILSRYIETIRMSPWAKEEYELKKQELAVMEAKGYSQSGMERWASSLMTGSSLTAAEIFQPGSTMPPFFLVLLFLRRKRMNTFALGIVFRHVELRLQKEHVSWSDLKILVIRMTRHARTIWPESIPWIASVFTSEAFKIVNSADSNGGLSANMLSDVTHFCNIFLSLLSLPASLHPILSSHGQQTAQFQVLQFMASCTPAVIVTRNGFRAVVRNQLAHEKTPDEREWAKLKGESWPPWRKNRTAMDEEKGYEFGTSRASRILHRMYEAGYGDRSWERLAALYAGWDTDLSPTIQTRTSLPYLSTQYRSMARLHNGLWAGRVQATRTRREAWACFLAYEASGTPARQEVYSAMFEKLHYSEMQREEPDLTRTDSMLLPGDGKEVVPEPESSLHLVYLNETIPSFEQLYWRMVAKGLRPTHRLLAFLLKATPSYDMGMSLLESAKTDFGGGIQCLLEGTYADAAPGVNIPGYIVAAFIEFLCRFGRFSRILSTVAPGLSPDEHLSRINSDRHYLLEYAQALLFHFQPYYRPAWTVYLRKVVSTSGGRERETNTSTVSLQYKIVCNLVEAMEKRELDLDDEQLQLVCWSISRTAKYALQGNLATDDAQHVLSSGAHRVRSIFHNLVNANLDINNTAADSSKISRLVPPHIPPAGVLHTYVRTLGILRDFEGLYSFATWAARHHAEVMARSNAQNSGPQALFRTIIALRAGLQGLLSEGRERASSDLVELTKMEIERVEGWGWPSDAEVEKYVSTI